MYDLRKYLLSFLLIFILTGCGTTLKQGFVSDAEVKVETEKQQDMVFSMFTKRRDKLHSIAYPLLVAAGDIFPKQARPICGFKLHDKYLYGKLLGGEYEEVAERHGIDELIRVGYIHPGLPVGLTDLKIGDQVLSINNKSLEGKNALDATKMIQHLKKDTSIKLLIKRDFQTKSLIVPCILGCRYPVKIANQDVVNAYADNKNVTVTTGLIRFCETSSEELAFVLGHEIAHNALKHVVKQQGNALIGAIVDANIQAATGVSTSGIFSDIGRGVFSIAFEEEADYAGLYILSRAKYDIAGTGNFIRRMAIEHPASMKGSFLATHPTTPKRFISIEHTINEINEKILNGMPIFPEKKTKDTDNVENQSSEDESWGNEDYE